MNRVARVLCVDDHDFLVDGLRMRLEVEPDMEFVGRLASADDLIAETRRTRADIVLLDIEMPGVDTFEALGDLGRICPDTRVIMLSAYVRDHYVDLASKHGAWGYLCKNDSPATVVEGIRRVLSGRVAMSRSVRERTAEQRTRRRDADPRVVCSRLATISEREKQVLRLIAKGLQRTQIADDLCISPATIDNHRKSIMRKLGISDRVELARFAIAEGLVEV